MNRRKISVKTELYIEELEEQLDTLESNYYDLELKYNDSKIYNEDLITLIIVGANIWGILLVIYNLY